jgi:MFS family permease
MNKSIRALAHRAYLFVWLGSLLSNIGNWMENVGQGWVVASQTHSAFMVELLSFAQFIPVVFLAIPSGILADNVNRKKLLISAQIAMCGFATLLAVLAHLGRATPWTIITITFLEGAAWAINAPAWQSIVPHLIPRKDLESAIALNSIQYNLARLLGPAIAGIVVHELGFAYAFDINALSFIAVIIALGTAKFDGKPPKVKVSDVGQYQSAWKWVWGHPGAKRIILSMTLFAIFAAPLQGLMPFFASDILHVGARGLGILLACLGAGAVTGAFLIGQLPDYYPRHHLIPLSLVCLGLFESFYSQSNSLILSYSLLFVTGIFWLSTMVSCNTALQLLVPDAIRGRAMSILLLANVGMLPVGHLMGGLVAGSIGPRATMFITSIILTMVGLFTLWKRVPEIDGSLYSSKKIKLNNLFSELILGTSHRADALALAKTSETSTKD